MIKKINKRLGAEAEKPTKNGFSETLYKNW